MNVYVWKDEMYPYYGIDAERGGVEIPNDLYNRYVKAEESYKEIQDELKKYSCE